MPAGLPVTLQLGAENDAGKASTLTGVAPFGYRYQYLSGGVNTGEGWATWGADGRFVTSYIQESAAARLTPVFTYYQLRESAPGKDRGEADGLYANLQDRATMKAYFEDLRRFFQRAGAASGTTVVLHVEPDLWGEMQQRGGDNAASVHAVVGSSGVGELAGLPDNMAGFARALAVLRDRYAPNVRLGYHVSTWGTGTDIARADPSDAQVDRLAGRAAAYYNSLGGGFDLLFGEFSDRDAGFYQDQSGDGGASWWDAADFRRHARFFGDLSRATGRRVILWQVPFGNTKRMTGNHWNAYQDNRVEWLLDDPAGTHLADYEDAGVIAFLFGRGADGTTCACDTNGDGRDEDGGYFKDRARAYYASGALALP